MYRFNWYWLTDFRAFYSQWVFCERLLVGLPVRCLGVLKATGNFDAAIQLQSSNGNFDKMSFTACGNFDESLGAT